MNVLDVSNGTSAPSVVTYLQFVAVQQAKDGQNQEEIEC